MRRIEIKRGDRYNMLTVISEVEGYVSPSGYKTRKFLFQCDCGNTKEIILNDVRTNASKSCGCYNIKKIKQRRTTHSLSQHNLYRTWNNMKQRCYNTNHPKYNGWGGRGIIVQDNWINDPARFINYVLNTIGDRPKGMTLDRKDNEGNYVEGNLKWSTISEQNKNQRPRKLQPTDSITGRFIKTPH